MAGAAGATPPLAQAAAETGLDPEVTTVGVDGTRTGARSWRVVRGTGNCCENYLATAPDGGPSDNVEATAPADETTQFWYHAVAPDGLTDTNKYGFGPVQARTVDGDEWVTAPGTEDTNAVLT